MVDDILKELKGAVIDQNPDVAVDLTKASLAAGISPNEVIDAISDGLKEVGDLFERHELFLPEVMRSANAAKRSLELVIPLVKKGGGGGKGGMKGAVAIGSLGPHDIGKTIIHSMLIAASFEVIDMGIMLTPEKVEKAIKENPAVKVLGLSVLLTSDIGKAGNIVRRAKAASPGIKVMVGGSAMSLKVMKEMEADGFGKNANEAVKLAKGFMDAGKAS